MALQHPVDDEAVAGGNPTRYVVLHEADQALRLRTAPQALRGFLDLYLLCVDELRLVGEQPEPGGSAPASAPALVLGAFEGFPELHALLLHEQSRAAPHALELGNGYPWAHLRRLPHEALDGHERLEVLGPQFADVYSGVPREVPYAEVDVGVRERVRDHATHGLLGGLHRHARPHECVVRQVGIVHLDVGEIYVQAPDLRIEVRDLVDLVTHLLAAEELLPYRDQVFRCVFLRHTPSPHEAYTPLPIAPAGGKGVTRIAYVIQKLYCGDVESSRATVRLPMASPWTLTTSALVLAEL